MANSARSAAVTSVSESIAHTPWSLVCQWDETAVVNFLASFPACPPDVVELVRAHAISGPVLCSLTAKDVDSLGVEKFGHGRFLLLAAEQLRAAAAKERLTQRTVIPRDPNFSLSDVRSRTLHCQRQMRASSPAILAQSPARVLPTTATPFVSPMRSGSPLHSRVASRSPSSWMVSRSPRIASPPSTVDARSNSRQSVKVNAGFTVAPVQAGNSLYGAGYPRLSSFSPPPPSSRRCLIAPVAPLAGSRDPPGGRVGVAPFMRSRSVSPSVVALMRCGTVPSSSIHSDASHATYR